MTNLDDKLKEILNDFGNSVKDQSSWMALGGEYEPKNDPIAQIKAAIAELVESCLPKEIDYRGNGSEWNDCLKEIRNNLIKVGVLK